MKLRLIVCTIALLLLLTTIALAAKPIINADQQYLDINTGLYVLKGHVYIEVGNRIITAGQAHINMISQEVWGTDGITVHQADIYFSGDNVYLYGKQNKADITGNVALSRNDLKINATQVEFDWDTKIATFSGQVQVMQDTNTYTTDRLSYNVITNAIL